MIALQIPNDEVPSVPTGTKVSKHDIGTFVQVTEDFNSRIRMGSDDDRKRSSGVKSSRHRPKEEDDDIKKRTTSSKT